MYEHTHKRGRAGVYPAYHDTSEGYQMKVAGGNLMLKNIYYSNLKSHTHFEMKLK